MDALADIEAFCREPVDVYLSQRSISWPMEENQVVTVFYNTTIPLKQFVAAHPHSSHLSKRLTAVTERFINMCPGRAPSAQVFGSGAVVLMGSPDGCTTRYFMHKLRKKIGSVPSIKRPKNGRIFPQNKVCSGCYDYCLDLDNFEIENRLNVAGDRSSFPGIVYMETLPGCKQKLSFSLFSTGKFNVMGVYQDQAIRGFTYMLNILKRNRIDGNIRMKADRNIKKIKAAVENRRPDESYIACVQRALSTIDDDYEDNNYDNEGKLQEFEKKRQQSNFGLRYVGNDAELTVAAYTEQKEGPKQRPVKRRRT